MSQLAEADHGVEGDTDEEDHDGVEEDVAVDDGEAGVKGEEHSSKGCCREALRQFPYCEETQGKGQNLSGERMDISSMRERKSYPNGSASKAHAQDGWKIFKRVAWHREVEAGIVTRYFAWEIMLKTQKGQILPNPAMISFPRGGCTSKKFVLLMYLNIFN